MKLGPRYKICKRLGASIFEKCQTQAFQLSAARSAKTRTKRGRRGGSEYQKQLIEKQKLRLSYGLSEKQFRSYINRALENHTNPPQTLFELLERRLDSVVYRMGLARTRREARQIVSHGHITVNGRRITIPSYQVKTTDAIAIREGSRGTTLFANASERLAEYSAPRWVSFDPSAMAGALKEAPVFSDQDMVSDIGAVFEYYTR